MNKIYTLPKLFLTLAIFFLCVGSGNAAELDQVSCGKNIPVNGYKIENLLKGIDTCGVMNLHGMLGLLGGIAAIFIVNGINKGSQIAGIGIAILIAIATGFIAGKIIAILGRRIELYDDIEELEL